MDLPRDLRVSEKTAMLRSAGIHRVDLVKNIGIPSISRRLAQGAREPVYVTSRRRGTVVDG